MGRIKLILFMKALSWTITAAVAVPVAFLLLVIASKSFTIIPAGHIGVVTQFGKVQEFTYDEGLHIKSPLSTVHPFSVQTSKVEAEALAASKDLQTVAASIAVNYRLKTDTIADQYRNVKGSYEATLAAPAIQEVVKSVTAQYTADELITKRAEVSELIQQRLAERLSLYAIVETVSITNFEFSESFNRAIEAKVTAEQDALASKNKLEQTKYEAEQTLVKAKAEAESIRIQAAALDQNQDLVSLRAVEKWDGHLPAYYSGDSLPFIQIR